MQCLKSTTNGLELLHVARLGVLGCLVEVVAVEVMMMMISSVMSGWDVAIL